jgi:hypothetical protein
MPIFLSVALLVVGLISTLSAFGGKTWKEGTEPILKRITLRGWISLSCLLLAVSLGVTKEISTNRAAAIAKQAAEKQHADELAANAVTQASLRGQVDKEEKEVEGLQKLNSEMKKHLEDQGVTLGDVRSNLKDTKRDLSQQNAISLITALANFNLTVSDVTIFLPFRPGVQASTFRQLLLPPFKEPACADVTGLRVGTRLETGLSDYNWTIILPEDTLKEHRYWWSIGDPFIDRLDQWSDYEDLSNLTTIMGKAARSGKTLQGARKEGMRYGLQYHPIHTPLSVGDLYLNLTTPGGKPLKIASTWPPWFRDEASYKRLKAKYPDLLEGSAYRPLYPTDTITNEGPYPQSCSREIEQYFKQVFPYAVLIVSFGQQQNEEMIFTLRPETPILKDSPRKKNDMWSVSYTVDPIPEIIVGGFDLEFTNEWPEPTKKRN